MRSKAGLAVAAGVALAVSAWAQSESMRPVFVRENRFPELGKFEVGTFVSHSQNDEKFLQTIDNKAYPFTRFTANDDKLDITTVEPYVKYGLYENLTAYARFPFSVNESDARRETDRGFNDVAVGLELLAYEYTYQYPWVIPYLEVTFPTGDEDERMGLGKVDGVVGIAVGTTTFDKYTWILDARYDANICDNGRFEGAGALIWQLSPRFSVLGEAKVTEKTKGSKDDAPVWINAGFCYRPTEPLSINLYGGTSVNAEEEGHGLLKVAYSF